MGRDRTTIEATENIPVENSARASSSYLRFQADLPNETWQSDFTHWRLSSGAGVEILTFLDDHSRLALSVTAYPVVTVALVLDQFRTTVAEYGPPASTLTDNGLVFTTRVRGGRNTFENELNLLGIDQKNGRPNHPQTQGKIERFHQTLKLWLRNQPSAATIAELNSQLARFQHIYNEERPHRALGRHTPTEAYHALPKAEPRLRDGDEHWRIRYDHVDAGGTITVRYAGKLRHLGIGRVHKNTPIVLLMNGPETIVTTRHSGEVLAEHTINPDKDYQAKK